MSSPVPNPFSNNPAFEGLVKAFNKFAADHGGKDMEGRALRSALAGAKASVDQALVEFPEAFVAGAVQDLYALMTDPAITDNISAVIRSFDEPALKTMIDGVKAQLMTPETSAQVAKQVKDLLKRASDDDLEDMVISLSRGRSASEQFMMHLAFMQVLPMIDMLRGMSEAQVAGQVAALAAQIPSDALAAQLATYTQAETPARVAQQAQALVDKLPTPEGAASIVHALGKAASSTLDAALHAPTPHAASSLIRDFFRSAGPAMKMAIANDNAGKKPKPPKTSRKFRL